MNKQARSRVFPRVRVVVLLAIASSILTMVAFVNNPKVADVGDSPDAVALSLSEFATGLKRPTSITNAGTGDDRLFVNEKSGQIKIVKADGTVVSEPFLDISERVTSEGEEGLLGLAFHPNYATNGYFFVNYTNMTSNVRRTRISRFKVSSDPNEADPNSEDILLTIVQPQFYHNAGDIHFGPEGYLYIPLGDGGGGGDTPQNLETLLGKIVRIDVNSLSGSQAADCDGMGSGNYRVPATGSSPNPFIDGLGGKCDEIWASGLRNPWRSSFDSLTGDLYIGDVGQKKWEEIDFQPADSKGGENYGWTCYEGNHPFNTGDCRSMDSYTFPIFEYAHVEDQCSGSVIGGYVYRGSKYPAMKGRYFLTDFCSGIFWDLVQIGDNWHPSKHTNIPDRRYSTFGEDSSGELYVASFNLGNIYLLVGEPVVFDEFVYLPVAMRPQEPGS